MSRLPLNGRAEHFRIRAIALRDLTAHSAAPLRGCRQALAQVSGIALIEQVVHRKPESPGQEGARSRSTGGKRGSVSMYLYRAMQGLDWKALTLQIRLAFQL